MTDTSCFRKKFRGLFAEIRLNKYIKKLERLNCPYWVLEHETKKIFILEWIGYSKETIEHNDIIKKILRS